MQNVIIVYVFIIYLLAIHNYADSIYYACKHLCVACLIFRECNVVGYIQRSPAGEIIISILCENVIFVCIAWRNGLN